MRRTVGGLILAGVLLAGGVIAQQKNQPEIDLQAAIRKETVDGDLKGAIEQYKKIIAANRGNHELAAKALIQLGQCYEKQGDAGAKSAYDQVLSEYADQKDLAATARVRLAALGGAAKPAGLTVRQVTGLPFTPEAASPDGRYLAHWKHDSKAKEESLEALDLGSGQVRKAIDVPLDARLYFNGDPLFSPDSRQMAYALGNIDMKEADIEDLLDREQDFAKDPEAASRAVSQVTSHMVYSLRAVNLDGSNGRVVAQFGANRIQLAGWFPDGKSMLAVILPGALGAGERTELSDMGVKAPPAETAPPRIVTVSMADGVVTPVTELPSLFGMVWLSPDGKFFAYRVRTGQNPPQADVRLFSLADSSDVALGLGPYKNISFEWTPNSDGIVYLSDRRGTSDLWYAAIANGRPQGQPQMLKADMDTAALFPITRDGSYYYSKTKTMAQILTAEFDPATGKVVKQPAPLAGQADGENLSPDFSPDGTTISYFRRDAKRPYLLTLVLHSLASGNERSVSTEFTDIYGPTHWLADSGSLLVVAHRTDGGRGIYRIEAASGASTLLRKTTFADVSWAHDLSKDGKALYYGNLDSSAKQMRVRALDIETGAEREILQVPASSLTAFQVSPDGRRLAIICDDGHSIDIAPLAGGDRREIYRVAAPDLIGNLRWSPDGRYILLPAWPEKDGLMDLRRVPAEGGPAVTILRGLEGMHGIWTHPDGRRLAFNRPVRTTEILALENFIPGLKTAK